MVREDEHMSLTRKHVLYFILILFWSSTILGIVALIRTPPLQMTGAVRTSLVEPYGIMITYPEEWEYTVTPRGIWENPDVIALFTFRNYLKLGIRGSIERMPDAAVTIEDVANRGDLLANNQLGYKEISLTEEHLFNERALKREYVFLVPATPLEPVQSIHCLESYRIHRGTGYLLSLCVNEEEFSRLRELFQSVINSMVFQE